MNWLPKGYYLCVGYQECAKEDPNEIVEHRCKHVDTVRLNLSSYEQLYESIHYSEPLDFHILHDLNENDLQNLAKYMDKSVPIDCDSYEYYLEICVENWLREMFEQKERERIKKWMEGLPDPKQIFALIVLEKGKEQGDGYEMPLWGIDVDEVREFFNLPAPQRFDWEDRLDKRMYQFISERIDCNNINIDKYDYRPIIRYNNYSEHDGVVVVPCHVVTGEIA